MAASAFAGISGNGSDLSLTSIVASGGTIQKGDSDTKHLWGGQKYAGIGGTPVADLQRALASVGTFTYKPDGDFGPRTLEAVRRFEWYITHMSYRLRVPPSSDEANGAIVPFSQPTGIIVDGRATATTLAELLAWVAGGFVTTSPLIRFDVGLLSRTQLAPTFKVLAYPSPKPKEALVHQDFVETMNELDDEAGHAKVVLRINQTFRDQNIPPTGAVVPPASKSQHLIGNAVDLNIVDGTTVNTSAMFLAGTQSEGAKEFVKAVKENGIRWGGDFSPKDPPHFDNFILPGSDGYKMSFYFAQRSYARQHPVRG